MSFKDKSPTEIYNEANIAINLLKILCVVDEEGAESLHKNLEYCKKQKTAEMVQDIIRKKEFNDL